MSKVIDEVVHEAGKTVVKTTKNTVIVLEKTGDVVTEISHHALGAGRVTIRALGKVISTVFGGK